MDEVFKSHNLSWYKSSCIWGAGGESDRSPQQQPLAPKPLFILKFSYLHVFDM